MIIDIHTHHILARESRRDEHPVEPLIAMAKQAGICRVNLLGNLARYVIASPIRPGGTVSEVRHEADVSRV